MAVLTPTKHTVHGIVAGCKSSFLSLSSYGPLHALRNLRRISVRIAKSESLIESYRAEIAIMRIALNHVGRGIQMIDGNGRVVLSNDKSAELLGVPKSFLQTKPLFSEVLEKQWTADEFSPCPPELKKRFASRTIFNRLERYRRVRPNGRVIEVESVPLTDGGVVRTHTDITERHDAEQRIVFLAHNDFLTGLANRASFQAAMHAKLEEGDGAAIMLLDVDHFKRVNDTHGHQFGDALLKEIASRLTDAVRDTDLVARLGGDEFAVLLSPVSDLAIAEAIAERIVCSMEMPLEQDGRMIIPGVSAGLAMFAATEKKDVDSGELLLWQADRALYSAKTAGRGRWNSFSPEMMESEVAERKLLSELRSALAAEQFEVWYQPILEIASRRISGFEALVRWRHPTRGLLAAGEFIPVVEESGLIVPLGLWVLRRACLDALEWPEDIRLLVNFSPRQLATPDLKATVADALQTAGLPASRLELEITETSIMQSTERTEGVLSDLRALGIHVALDDFGTGFSSLSHIRIFRFDTIKIDRSFVADAPVQSSSGAIVRAVSSLARELGIRTIAEGVETEEQLAWIQANGCDEAQGYLFSRPIPHATSQNFSNAPGAT